MRVRRRSMIAITSRRWPLLDGIWATIRPQGRATLVAILRAIEVFCFAPVTGNHRRHKKQVILARNAVSAPTHHNAEGSRLRRRRSLIRAQGWSLRQPWVLNSPRLLTLLRNY